MSAKKKLKQPVVELKITSNKKSYPPLFCLRYIHKDYCIEKLESEDKVALIEKLEKLSKITWNEIKTSPRHGLGTEKLPRSAISKEIPSSFTDDVENFLVFRFNGKKPMVGHRSGDIFHILFIDKNFTLYNHG